MNCWGYNVRVTSPNDPSATRWSRIAAGDLDHVIRNYWKPIRRFLSGRLAGAEDADDATQELFLAFLQKDFLTRADPERGSFRSLLYHAARGFAVDRIRRATAEKRGGGRVRSLESEGAPEGSDTTPEAEFDREFYRSLFNRVRRELRNSVGQADRMAIYDVFHLHVLGDGTAETWTRAKIAERLDLSPDQVKHHLSEARRRFSALMRNAVREYAEDETEVASEIDQMARVLSDRMPEIADSLVG